ncbi:MAG: N-6 DNA methylase [Planctomycetota bacterium]|nr:N-6 DNA methylase [Planctomycetota bacterium]
MAEAGTKLDRSVYEGDLGLGPLFNSTVYERDTVIPLLGYNPADPEESYCDCVPENHRKRLGQFFTPAPIANMMCSWILASKPSQILDPAVGPGIFVREILKQSPTSHICTIDVDPLALAAAKQVIGNVPSVEFIQADFLTWRSDRRFDGAIANPPYLKHHNFFYRGNIFSEIGFRNHVNLSRLTNIYGLFILEICRRLKTGGRAAILVPGEWVNANFGMPLKNYLLSNGLLKVLIYFSHYSLLFDNALTTASVLFIEKPERCKPRKKILTSYIKDRVNVALLKPLAQNRFPECDGVRTQWISTDLLLKEKKWDYVLGHVCDEALEGFVPLSDMAETRRGIATGANKYFHLSADAARNNNIPAGSILECVGRSADVPSFIFLKSDFESLVAKGRRTCLLNFQGALTVDEKDYITRGETDGLPKRYLLAARDPWYTMERRNPSSIWAVVFGRKGLRFILNAAAVHNLTAFHCIYPISEDPLFIKALVGSLNSRKVQHLAKRHRRVYGGGLSKFEPRDLLDIQVPDLRVISRATLQDLANALDRLDKTTRQKQDIPEEDYSLLNELVDKAAEEAVAVKGSKRRTEPLNL